MAKKEIGFFYRPSTKKALWALLWFVCILSVLFELPLHRHSHFAETGFYSMDGQFGFYAILGFLGCSAMILVAKFLGIFLKTKEKFYD